MWVLNESFSFTSGAADFSADLPAVENKATETRPEIQADQTRQEVGSGERNTRKRLKGRHGRGHVASKLIGGHRLLAPAGNLRKIINSSKGAGHQKKLHFAQRRAMIGPRLHRLKCASCLQFSFCGGERPVDLVRSGTYGFP